MSEFAFGYSDGRWRFEQRSRGYSARYLSALVCMVLGDWLARQGRR